MSMEQNIVLSSLILTFNLIKWLFKTICRLVFLNLKTFLSIQMIAAKEYSELSANLLLFILWLLN